GRACRRAPASAGTARRLAAPRDNTGDRTIMITSVAPPTPSTTYGPVAGEFCEASCPMPAPGIVVPVREGPVNEQLRYALRSWTANLPHRQVWLVGGRPTWAVN